MNSPKSPIYLDCAASAPMDTEVIELVTEVMASDFGNASSRTHTYGQRAKALIERARDQVSDAFGVDPGEVVFTSGATESNNLFIAGVVEAAVRNGRRHIVASAIEHKAVLEPLTRLAAQGIEVTFVPPRSDGIVKTGDVMAAVRDDTALVSLMAVNNETGAIQPTVDIGKHLAHTGTLFHVDAAQLFGKAHHTDALLDADLVSVSGHKFGGPKGVGIAIVRKRKSTASRLTPLIIGGGQERGMRGGTLPTPLVAGLGLAVKLAATQLSTRIAACKAYRARVVPALLAMNAHFNCDPKDCVASILSVRLQGIDSEAAIVALKDQISISTGSACTSERQIASHVLLAMGLTDNEISSTIRLSWNHKTPEVNWAAVERILEGFE